MYDDFDVMIQSDEYVPFGYEDVFEDPLAPADEVWGAYDESDIPF